MFMQLQVGISLNLACVNLKFFSLRFRNSAMPRREEQERAAPQQPPALASAAVVEALCALSSCQRQPMSSAASISGSTAAVTPLSPALQLMRQSGAQPVTGVSEHPVSGVRQEDELKPPPSPPLKRRSVSEHGAKCKRPCGQPIARRTMADLKADEKKTGIKVPTDLPIDFPRGPWIVDLSKPAHHAPSGGHDGGWKYQEEQMVVQWKCWCSDPNTPVEQPGLDLDKYCRGGFQLVGTTRSIPTSSTGTVKRARCTGRVEGDKGAPRPCSFKIQAEFVSEVLPGKHGWVLRSVEGANHVLEDCGKTHALVSSRSTVMQSSRLRKGTSRLRQTEYFKTGMRMKAAGNTCAMIYETLCKVATEEGSDPLFTLADVREDFGPDSKTVDGAPHSTGHHDKHQQDKLQHDKHQQCVMACWNICSKLKGHEEDCEAFFKHLSNFEKQLASRKRKRKATPCPGPDDSAAADAEADQVGSGVGLDETKGETLAASERVPMRFSEVPVRLQTLQQFLPNAGPNT